MPRTFHFQIETLAKHAWAYCIFLTLLMFATLVLFVAACGSCFLQRALGLQLWASPLRFVSSDDILAWVGHLRALPMAPWFQFRFAISVMGLHGCFTMFQSQLLFLVVFECFWCVCMFKGAVGSATDEWGICRQIVKNVGGFGIAQTCGNMWVYKIVQDPGTFAKWPAASGPCRCAECQCAECEQHQALRSRRCLPRGIHISTVKHYFPDFSSQLQKLSIRRIPRYFKQVYVQQQQINSAGALGSWHEFTRSRACYLLVRDLCPLNFTADVFLSYNDLQCIFVFLNIILSFFSCRFRS